MLNAIINRENGVPVIRLGGNVKHPCFGELIGWAAKDALSSRLVEPDGINWLPSPMACWVSEIPSETGRGVRVGCVYYGNVLGDNESSLQSDTIVLTTEGHGDLAGAIVCAFLKMAFKVMEEQDYCPRHHLPRDDQDYLKVWHLPMRGLDKTRFGQGWLVCRPDLQSWHQAYSWLSSFRDAALDAHAEIAQARAYGSIQRAVRLSQTTHPTPITEAIVLVIRPIWKQTVLDVCRVAGVNVICPRSNEDLIEAMSIAQVAFVEVDEGAMVSFKTLRQKMICAIICDGSKKLKKYPNTPRIDGSDREGMRKVLKQTIY